MTKRSLIIAATLTLTIAFGVAANDAVNKSKKFWAHRCNSIEKFNAMSNRYVGVEIDAYFFGKQPHGRKFRIDHDWPTDDLTLEDFMSTIAQNDALIWFDFKNLLPENVEAAIDELDQLLEEYHVDKRRLIIEGTDIAALGRFRQHGFYTSYFVPIDNDAYGDEVLRDEKIILRDEGRANYFCRVTRAAAESGCVDAISFPCTYYLLMQYADVDIDLLTWHTHGERWWQFYVESRLRKILCDERVKVILVET